jgi:thiosulfate sulfurtransferase
MTPPAPLVPEVTIDQAKEQLDAGQAVFVDVRDSDSFQQARIPGALNLNNGNVQTFLQETTKDQTIVVYCYHGNMSKGATDFFLRQGFESVHSMAGGFESWRLAYDFDSGVTA